MRSIKLDRLEAIYVILCFVLIGLMIGSAL